MSSIKDRIREKIKQKQKEAKEKAKNEKKDPLFDNPVFIEMKNSLPIEEQKRYEEMGQHMYNTIDVDFNEKGEMTSAVEMVSQIKVMLNSGMHPSYLSKEEKEFLEKYLGKEWYKEFGFLECDLNRVNM